MRDASKKVDLYALLMPAVLVVFALAGGPAGAVIGFVLCTLAAVGYLVVVLATPAVKPEEEREDPAPEQPAPPARINWRLVVAAFLLCPLVDAIVTEGLYYAMGLSAPWSNLVNDVGPDLPWLYAGSAIIVLPFIVLVARFAPQKRNGQVDPLFVSLSLWTIWSTGYYSFVAINATWVKPQDADQYQGTFQWFSAVGGLAAGALCWLIMTPPWRKRSGEVPPASEHRRTIYREALLWLGGVMLLALLVVAYLGAQDDWRSASESLSASNDPIVVCALGGVTLDARATTRILYGTPQFSTEHKPVVGVLPFSLMTTNKNHVSDATLTIRYHEAHQHDCPSSGPEPHGPNGAAPAERSFFRAGPVQYAAYVFSTLSPGQPATASEPIYLENTEHTLTALMASGERTSFKIEVPEPRTFDASVAFGDSLARDYRVSLEVVEASSFDDLKQRVAAEWLQRQQELYRDNVTFRQYLRALLFGAETDAVFLIYGGLDEHGVASRNPTVRRAPFRPVSWSLLFH